MKETSIWEEDRLSPTERRDVDSFMRIVICSQFACHFEIKVKVSRIAYDNLALLRVTEFSLSPHHLAVFHHTEEGSAHVLKEELNQCKASTVKTMSDQ